jgi:hypothetical protein
MRGHWVSTKEVLDVVMAQDFGTSGAAKSSQRAVACAEPEG